MKRFLAVLLILTSMLGLCACAPAQEEKYVGTWVDELGGHVIILKKDASSMKAYLSDGTVYDWEIALQPKVSFKQPKYTVLYDTIEFYIPNEELEEETTETPVIDATEAATEATEAATEATEPATEATEAATEATEPATEATEPATEATEPATEATEPATEATEPATEATEPATEATEPATEATEPATEATEPATEATEPATEATEPATEATEPATEATEPAKEKSPVLIGKLVIKNGLMTLVIIDATGRELYTLTKRY